MKNGFTLIELLIVLSITIIVGAVMFANLGARKLNTDLIVTNQQIGSLLRQAQTDSMDQENDVAWGVHFSNTTSTPPFYALFQTSYSTSSVVGGLYRLPSTVAFTTSTIAQGATLDVIFSSVTRPLVRLHDHRTLYAE